MLRTPTFWLLYVMMTLVTAPGLLIIAHGALMARDFGVAAEPVTLFGITAAAVTYALTLERLCSGVTRPIFGWISDYLGREKTMFLAFSLEGVAFLLLIRFGHIPVLFVLLVALVFFAWGEIFSLFPALAGDLFGRKYATTNYGLLYTAKGTAGLLVQLGTGLQERAGSWMPVLGVAVALDWVVALVAITVLPHLRKRKRPEPPTEPKP
jgi:OFA family oxalate/formate antiporter-like MFS transporter